MPWKDVSLLSQREEFVLLSRHEGAAISQLCRRFGVSRKTGYKWLGRFAESGRAGLSDRSRRPHRSPEQTTVEQHLSQQHAERSGRPGSHGLPRQGVQPR